YASAISVIMFLICLVFAHGYIRLVMRRDIEGAVPTVGGRGRATYRVVGGPRSPPAPRFPGGWPPAGRQAPAGRRPPARAWPCGACASGGATLGWPPSPG